MRTHAKLMTLYVGFRSKSCSLGQHGSFLELNMLACDTRLLGRLEDILANVLA